MDIKERLKTLKIDPLYRTSLDKDLALCWQRNSNIKYFLAGEIRQILKEIYEPMGMWGQNPNTKDKVDLGVIIDGKWSELMQGDTHYTGHIIIFNKCNKSLVDYYRKTGKESIEIDGTIFSYKDQIVFSFDDTESETIEKIKKILKIVRYKKEKIFLIGCDLYNILIESYKKTMDRGDEAQKFYEKDIHFFFPDLIEYTSTKGRGDYNDRKEGVDVWKKHVNYNSTDQIKSVGTIIDKRDYYIINAPISQKSKCDYFVFVVVGKRIIIFKNDNSKIKYTNEGVKFPKELRHKEKLY